MMRCPTCLFDGKRHSVRAASAPGHDGRLPVTEFWDEDCQYHVHDHTVISGLFICSNGHEWWLKHVARCPQQNCEFNIQPEARGQSTAQIPGRTETIAAFRSRKISQWLRLRSRIVGIRLENSGPFFTSFAAVMADHVVVFGETPLDKGSFIDLSDSDVITLLNGDEHEH